MGQTQAGTPGDWCGERRATARCRMSMLARENLDAIFSGSRNASTALFDMLAEEFLGPDQVPWDDIELKEPEEFVMFYIDLAERGILPHLAVVSPHFSEEWSKRFGRDAAKVMGLKEPIPAEVLQFPAAVAQLRDAIAA